MSDNVEVARRVLDAINRGDFDGAVANFTEDFEFDFSNSKAELSGIYRGREEAKRFLTSFWEPWESVQFDPDEEIIELEDGRILTVNAVRGRGSASGAEVAATGATVWTLRDGEVMAAKMYQSKNEALEAASAER
jgi:ketosteroid isomerase-like protein